LKIYSLKIRGGKAVMLFLLM